MLNIVIIKKKSPGLWRQLFEDNVNANTYIITVLMCYKKFTHLLFILFYLLPQTKCYTYTLVNKVTNKFFEDIKKINNRKHVNNY